MERKKSLTPFNHTKGGNIPKYIVIHYTGNMNDSDEGNAKYFASDGRKASAHYFVDEDSCTQVVNDTDRAWHVGDNRKHSNITNSNSIGIEMCGDDGEVLPKTEENTLILVKELMDKYKIPKSNVVRHFDASGKNCPSAFNKDGKWTRWIEFKNKINEEPVTVSTLNLGDKGEMVKTLQSLLISKGYKLIADGDFGNKTLEAVKDFQTKNKLKVDGIVGYKTLSLLKG